MSFMTPQQMQALAWQSDLAQGDVTQQGAAQAYAGLQGLGAAAPSTMQYSVPAAGGGLSYLPYLPPAPTLPKPTAPVASQPTQAQAISTRPASRALTGTADGTAAASAAPYPTSFGTTPMAGTTPQNYQSAISAMMGGSPAITQGPLTGTPAAGVWTPNTGATAGPYGTQDPYGGLAYTSTPGNFPTGTPMVPNAFDPQFLQNYANQTGQTATQLGQEWMGAPWGTMQAAQMNTGNVPQVQATLPNSNFAALNFLLSGQGFDPATLARMNAQATTGVAQGEAGTMSAARLAASRAGLLNSGLGVGLQANVANQADIQRNQLLNQIAIQNAQQGIQNLQQGANLYGTMSMNSAQQANQVALQNAANMFSSMTQNLANQQASNAANFAGQQQRALGQAQAQSGYTGGAGQNLQNAMTNQYYGANVQNANLANQQWISSAQNLGNLYAGAGTPSAATQTQAASATVPNTVLGNAATTAGTNLGQSGSIYGG